MRRLLSSPLPPTGLMMAPAYTPTWALVFEMATRPLPALVGQQTNMLGIGHPLPWVALALAAFAALIWQLDVLPAGLQTTVQWAAVLAAAMTLASLLLYAPSSAEQVRLSVGLALLLLSSAAHADLRWLVTVPLALATMVLVVPGVTAEAVRVDAVVVTLVVTAPAAAMFAADHRVLRRRLATVTSLQMHVRQVERDRDRTQARLRSLAHDSIGALSALRNVSLAARTERLPASMVDSAAQTAASLSEQFEEAVTGIDEPTIRGVPLGPVDLHAEMAEVTELVRLRLLAARGDLQVRGTFPTVVGDALAIRQVLHSLVDNAIKHADRSRPLHLAVTGTVTGRAWHLTVTGPSRPLPAEMRESVFVAGVRSGDRHGFGQGLTDVQHAVATHGGRVWLDDVAGDVVAHVLLPLAQVPDDQRTAARSSTWQDDGDRAQDEDASWPSG